jgi:hypothetical protein
MRNSLFGCYFVINVIGMSMREYETVIIGGGQAVLATAYQHTRRGLPSIIQHENK